jgi:hypothetical protein
MLLEYIFSRIHPERCIGFIEEEEAKTVDTTPKGYSNIEAD